MPLLSFLREVLPVNDVVIITMSVHSINPPLDGLCDQAAQWVSRLSSDDVCEEDREAFALWLATSPAHGAAMDATLDMWQDLAVVKIWDLDPEATPQAAGKLSRRSLLAGGAMAIAASLLAFTLLPLGSVR